MSLLLDLLGFPLMGPVKGIKWIGEKVKEVADQQLTDRSRQQADLIELSMRYEMGEMGEEEFKKREDEILQRIGAGEKMKK